jgi:hypothetical protein
MNTGGHIDFKTKRRAERQQTKKEKSETISYKFAERLIYWQTD